MQGNPPQACDRSGGLQVKSVNGTPVKNLEGLVAAVEECKEHFLKFQLEYSQVLPSSCCYTPVLKPQPVGTFCSIPKLML